LIHVIPMDSQLEFALEPFLYPQNITLYDEYIEQVIIDLELVLRPREAIKMNWHQVTKRELLRDYTLDLLLDGPT